MMHLPGITHPPGEVAWHYTTRFLQEPRRIIVIRYGEHPYAVCRMDTRSNPQVEADADAICMKLNTR